MLPNLQPNKKIAVLFSGGLASTMATILAIEKYGINNVVAVFIPMTNIKSGQDTLLQNRTETFNQLTDELAITNKVMLLTQEDYAVNDIDNLLVDIHRLDFSQSLITILANKGYDVQNLILGNAKLDAEIRDLLNRDRFADGVIGNIDADGVKEYVEANPEKYSEIIAHNVLDSYGQWIANNIFYKIEESKVDNKDLAVFPFTNTSKKQIVAMYKEKGLEDLLAKTKSCSRSLDHCGICTNCFQREIALS
jgi:hypothetical protein